MSTLKYKENIFVLSKANRDRFSEIFKGVAPHQFDKLVQGFGFHDIDFKFHSINNNNVSANKHLIIKNNKNKIDYLINKFIYRKLKIDKYLIYAEYLYPINYSYGDFYYKVRFLFNALSEEDILNKIEKRKLLL